MLTIKKAVVFITASLATSAISAASLDFRQEYKHDQEAYASRVKIGASVGDHYFGVEAKQAGKPFSEWERADNEFEYGYHFYKEGPWRATASMPLTFGSDSITYKPQLRIQYKFDSGLVAKLRYRHEFRFYDSDSSNDDRDRSKITTNLAYNWEAFQFDFETNYAENWTDWVGEWPMSAGDKEWDYNLKVGYKEQGWKWRPYVEFGNVQCTSSSVCDSKRQLRSRIGVTYSF